MDLVKPWLLKSLLEEVKPILDWREGQEHGRGQSQDLERRVVEEDSGVLCITPTRMDQLARILKIQTHQNPTRIHISDTDTRLSATLAASATHEHFQKHRREFSAHTLGGILQLNDYEFKVTSLGPKQSQITLLVRKFTFVGAGGTTIAHIPRPIEDVKVAKDLLFKLDQRHKARESSKSKDTSTRQSSPSTSGFPSPATGSSVAVSPLATVENLAFPSQLPTQNPVHSTIRPTLGRQHSPPRSTLANNGTRQWKSPAKSGNHGNHHLLKMIMRKQPENRSLGTLDTPGTDKGENGVLAQELEQSQQEYTIAKADGGARATQQMVNSVDSARDDAEPVGSQDDMTHASAIYTLQGSGARLAASDDQLDGPEYGIDTAMTQNTAPITLGTASGRRGPSSRSRRLGKLSIRDIRIPKEQEDLLTRPDSWFPAAPNQQEPSANIPLSILNIINTRSNRQLQRANGVQQARDNAATSSDESDKSASEVQSNASTESEALSGWQPSPQRGPNAASQLPPDSSPNTPAESAFTIFSGDSRTGPDAQFSIYDDQVQKHTTFSSFNGCESSPRSSPLVPLPPKGYVTTSDIRSPSNIDHKDQNLDEPSPSFSQGKVSPGPQTRSSSVQQRDKANTAPGHYGDHDHCSVPSSLPNVHDVPLSAQDEEGETELNRVEDRELIPSTAIRHHEVSIQVKRTPHTHGPPPKSKNGTDPANSSTEASTSVICESTYYSSGPPRDSGASNSLNEEHLSSSLDNDPTTQDEDGAYRRITPTEPDDGGSYYEAPDFQAKINKHNSDAKKRPSDASPRESSSFKRSKVSDFLADSLVQLDEQPIAPDAMADQFRRRFFEHRNSAGSFVASSQTSPVKHSSSHSVSLNTTPHKLVDPAVVQRDWEEIVPSSFGSHSRSPKSSDRSPMELDLMRSLSANNDDAVFDDETSPEKAQSSPGQNLNSSAIKADEQDTDNQRTPDIPLKSSSTSRAVSSSSHGVVRNPAHDHINLRDKMLDQSPVTSSHPASVETVLPQSTRLTPNPGNLNKQENSQSENGQLTDKSTSDLPQSTVSTHSHDHAQKSIQDLVTASPKRSVFERFSMAYPEYDGSLKHFTSLCSIIARQIISRSVFPLSLWDDFIVRHRLEYCPYKEACNKDGEEGLSYEEYYSSSCEEPKYLLKILRREDVLAFMTPVGSASWSTNTPQTTAGLIVTPTGDLLERASQSVSRIVKNSEQRRSENAIQEAQEFIKAPSPEIQISSGARPSAKRSSTNKRNQCSSPVTIDLTNDEPSEIDKLPERSSPLDLTASRRSGPRRELPWSSTPKNRDRQAEPLSRDQRPNGQSSKGPHEKEGFNSLSKPAKTKAPRRSSNEWSLESYRDPHNPYNDWHREYNKIFPASNNSFAATEHKKRGKQMQKRWLAAGPQTRVWAFADMP